MRQLFITATDTDAGKTFVTAALVRALRQAGSRVKAAKPVACGADADGRYVDIVELLAAQGLPTADTDAISRYRFAAPLAPMQAAAAEGAAIDGEALVQWCNGFCQADAINLIEGVGGLMVPLAENYLVCDWIANLPDAEILLVVRSRLGGINHMLLTLDKLARMNRVPRWVVLNDADAAGEAMLMRHKEALAPWLDPARTTVIAFPFAGHSGRLRAAEERLLHEMQLPYSS